MEPGPHQHRNQYDRLYLKDWYHQGLQQLMVLLGKSLENSRW